MLVNRSELPSLNYRNFGVLKTPTHKPKNTVNLPKKTYNKSMDKNKLTIMVDRNNKFERELINS